MNIKTIIKSLLVSVGIVCLVVAFGTVNEGIAALMLISAVFFSLVAHYVPGVSVEVSPVKEKVVGIATIKTTPMQIPNPEPTPQREEVKETLSGMEQIHQDMERNKLEKEQEVLKQKIAKLKRNKKVDEVVAGHKKQISILDEKEEETEEEVEEEKAEIKCPYKGCKIAFIEQEDLLNHIKEVHLGG